MSPAEQQLEAEKAAAQVDQGLGREGLGVFRVWVERQKLHLRHAWV